MVDVAILSDGRHFARFHANPYKIRVSVRKILETPRFTTWSAMIMEIATRAFVTARGRTAARAVAKALREAERAQLDGIDVDMQWAYDHPQAPRGR